MDIATESQKKFSNYYLAFLWLSGIFLASLVLTNVIAGKFFELNIFGKSFPLSCGVIAYPVTFIVTDVISEIYGYKKARSLVIAGFVVSLFVLLILFISSAVPFHPTSPVKANEFNAVFGLAPGIVIGSMCAYLTSQWVDVKLFEFYKKLTNGKYLWLRNNGSTIVSQLIDTTLVVTIALVIWPKLIGSGQAIDMNTWWAIVIGQYLFKVIIAAFDTPLVYLVVSKLKYHVK